MSEKLAELIAEYKKYVETYDAETDEINEYRGEEFDVSTACGANYDDAYELGCDHGEAFACYQNYVTILSKLEELAKEGR